MAPGSAIPPHRLSLQEVLRQPCRVALCRVVAVSQTATETAREERYDLVVVEYVWGRGPLGARRGVYTAAYPYRMPDGKVEAPIYTGSGLEHEVRPQGEYLFVLGESASQPEHVRRIEPPSRRADILDLLQPNGVRH